MRIIALSPHVDDIAFSVGATILNDFFGNVMVATVFSRSRCTIDDSESDTDCITRKRKGEDKLFFSAAKAKIERVYLDRLDAPLRLGIKDEDVFGRELSDSDLEEVQKLIIWLEGVIDKHTLLLAPLGLERHVDHMIVHQAAGNTLSRGVSIAFYEDLPYAALRALSEIERIAKEVGSNLQTDLEPFLIQTGLDAKSKILAIKAYKSQVDEHTINRIISHGKKLGGNVLVERVWCNPKAIKILGGLNFSSPYDKFHLTKG